MRTIIKIALSVTIILLSLVAGGCSDKTDFPSEEMPKLSVTLVPSIGGSGDNGYNDRILTGVLRYYHNHEDEVSLSIRSPKKESDVEGIITEWTESEIRGNGSNRSLLLLASESYKEFVKKADLQLKSHQRILLFECNHDGLGENISTFRIGRYGAACLAGLMAGESPEAYILSAYPDNLLLLEAEEGFAEGFEKSSDGKQLNVNYLSDSEEGFSLPEKAYGIVKEIDEAFIFPLAGGSNNGIFRYSRENYFILQLISGMDVDCSDYSTRIPFSMVINIDSILQGILEEWHAQGSISSHTEYFLGEGAEIVVNPFFFDRAYIFRDYYIDPEYWELQKEKYVETAKEMERRYYEK